MPTNTYNKTLGRRPYKTERCKLCQVENAVVQKGVYSLKYCKNFTTHCITKARGAGSMENRLLCSGKLAGATDVLTSAASEYIRQGHFVSSAPRQAL